MARLILASASPQRKELLAGLGVSFEVIPSMVEEGNEPETDPAKRAQILARLKAEDTWKNHQDAWVIGCDTLVMAADGSLLEKPVDAEDARRMLKKLSGQTAIVYSALCVIDPSSRIREGLSSSSVSFKDLSREEMDWWIGTGSWQGRSGSFQIDGPGQLMIERIEGDWTGIVGLSVYLLGELFEKFDTTLMSL